VVPLPSVLNDDCVTLYIPYNVGSSSSITWIIDPTCMFDIQTSALFVVATVDENGVDMSEVVFR